MIWSRPFSATVSSCRQPGRGRGRIPDSSHVTRWAVIIRRRVVIRRHRPDSREGDLLDGQLTLAPRTGPADSPLRVVIAQEVPAISAEDRSHLVRVRPGPTDDSPEALYTLLTVRRRRDAGGANQSIFVV